MSKHTELADTAYREAFVATRESCVINSGPGCGKTHTCIRKVRETPDTCFAILVYNKAVAAAIRAELAGVPNGDVYTVHAMARKLLYGARPSMPILVRGQDAFKKKKKHIKERCLERLTGPSYLNDLMHVGKTLADCKHKGIVSKKKTLTRCFKLVFDMNQSELGPSNEAGRCRDVIESEIFDAVQQGFYDFDWAVQTCIRKGLCEQIADEYDCLIFDEAQDLSKDLYEMKPRTKESMQIIYMGDTNQSIYGFDDRCFNAFDNDDVSKLPRFDFTQSFRCSPDVVELVKTECPRLDIQMCGNPALRTAIYGNINEFRAEAVAVTALHYLAWSANSIVSAIITACQHGHDYRFVGKDSEQFMDYLTRKTKDGKLSKDTLLRVQSTLPRYNQRSPLVFSTVHQAKGLTLANVATHPHIHDLGTPQRLRFVALTRATDNIFTGFSAIHLFDEVLQAPGPQRKRCRCQQT